MNNPLVLAALVSSLAGPAIAQCDPRLADPGVDDLDRFGISVGLSGDWAAVGAFGDGQAGIKAGAVHTYEWVAGSWQQRQKLVPADAQDGDLFGASVGLDGGTLVIGAPSHDGAGYGAGAVYVYERGGGTYVERQKLFASDALPSDDFGFAVAIDGDRLVVGARFGDAPGAVDAGAAYVFERIGGIWTEVAKLVANDAGTADYFGQSLDLDGDAVVVGAWGNDDLGSGTGSAYVYRASGGWAQEKKLMANDAAALDYFGFDVAIEGDVIAVSAQEWEGNLGNEGVVYVYRFSGTWKYDQFLPGVHAGGQFGTSVALDSGWLVASAVNGQGIAPKSGDAVYLADDGDDFAFVGRLVAHDGESNDRFGVSVALDGNRTLIGAEGEDTGGPWAGAAYGFDLPFADANLDGRSDDCGGGVVVFCECTQGAPCGNVAPDGCMNSTGQGGALSVLSGSFDVTQDDLVLRSEALPASTFGLLFMGPDTVAPAFMADGLRCVGGQLHRFPARPTGPGGSFDEGPGMVAHSHANFEAPGVIMAGQTWRFQTWYRDAQGPCGRGSNVTNGLAITFEP